MWCLTTTEVWRFRISVHMVLSVRSEAFSIAILWDKQADEKGLFRIQEMNNTRSRYSYLNVWIRLHKGCYFPNKKMNLKTIYTHANLFFTRELSNSRWTNHMVILINEYTDSIRTKIHGHHRVLHGKKTIRKFSNTETNEKNYLWNNLYVRSWVFFPNGFHDFIFMLSNQTTPRLLLF